MKIPALSDDLTPQAVRVVALAKRLVPFVGLLLFIAAILALRREVSNLSLSELRTVLAATPFRSLGAALAIVVANYLLLTANDWQALAQIGARLPYSRVAATSFASNAIGFNVGMAMLSGGSVRYRLYSALGLDAVSIAKVVALCQLTIVMGTCTVGGAALLLEPVGLFVRMGWPSFSHMLIGICFLALPCALFGLSFAVRGGRLFKVKGHEIHLPSPEKLLLQGMIGAADHILASLVVYALLPHGGDGNATVGVFAFCGAFILSMVLGEVSQIPGGLGVFEFALIWQMAPYYDKSQLVGALLLYRVFYYILPLVVSVILLVGVEASGRIALRIGVFAESLLSLLPSAVALWTFFAGVSMLLTSAASPGRGILQMLQKSVSLPILEGAHFLKSLLGTLLLFLAWGLAKRIRGAWFASVCALFVAAAATLTSGLHYGETVFMLVLVGVLVACKKYFYRQSLFSAFDERWVFMIALVLAAFAWLGFFSFRHVEYSNELWWRFAFFEGAPRFLRASVGVCLTIVVSFFFFWTRPKPPLECAFSDDEIRRLVSFSASTDASLAFLGDKKFFLGTAPDTAIMYGMGGEFWVSMGDPIGDERGVRDTIWQFCEYADRLGAKPVFYEVGAHWQNVYRDVGLRLSPIGESASVDLAELSDALEGSKWKGFRAVLRRFETTDCTFRVVDGGERDALLPALKAISDEWLSSKQGQEKGFSLGFFDERYLRHFPIAVAECEQRPLAFCNLWVGGTGEELSVDLMRYTSQAPHDMMSYLFVKTMLWGKRAGFKSFRLGMAPLSNLDPHGSLFERAGNFVYEHGERVYNFQGLQHYKDKFHPVWSPRYLAYPGWTSLPVLLPQLVRLVQKANVT